VIQPRGARVLVKRIEQARPETQLIIVPETVEDKPSQYGLVLAFGRLVQGGIVVGDIVLLKDYAGAPCFTRVSPEDTEDTECALVNEDDVLAVVEGV